MPTSISLLNKQVTDWYYIDKADDVDSPALLIYLERVKHNIELAIAMVGDASRLRPHVKTHKTKEATLLMMQAGIMKFKCATIAEAEMLGICGAADVLLAYQPVGPKVKRFISLIENFPGTQFSCLIDNIESARFMAVEAQANNIATAVFIDLNVGMNRTGILPQNALELYKSCGALEGLNIVGIHAYDGHINDSDLQVRKQRADKVFERAVQVKNELMAAGLMNPVMVIGGSPSFPIHANRKDVECSPGTFVYWDKSYGDLFPDMGFLPAALVITRVVK